MLSPAPQNCIVSWITKMVGARNKEAPLRLLSLGMFSQHLCQFSGSSTDCPRRRWCPRCQWAHYLTTIDAQHPKTSPFPDHPQALRSIRHDWRHQHRRTHCYHVGSTSDVRRSGSRRIHRSVEGCLRGVKGHSEWAIQSDEFGECHSGHDSAIQRGGSECEALRTGKSL